jgi:diguanylate cyclase (GGDEF)-like protein
MNPKKFDELKHSGQLPTPSGLGLRILVLTQKEDVFVDEIVRTIQADPALTGRIIKLASSVQMSGAVAVSTVKEAAVRLGMRTVANLALGFTLVSGNRAGRCEAFDYDRYWSWSLANAVAAQTISKELRIAVPAEVFTGALLVRIGKLALASVYPSDYSKLLKRLANDSDATLLDLERKVFGIHHREVAASLLAEWGLPPQFAETALVFDGNPPTQPFEHAQTNDFIRILNASSEIADVCLSEQDRQHHRWPKLRQTCGELGIQAIDFCKLFDKVVPAWREWGKLLEVPTNKVLSSKELESRSEPADVERLAVRQAGKGIRILAVDDEPTSLHLLAKVLAKEGHEVLTATNGKEALAIAVDKAPQIVVTDWMMPEMDGLELCKVLRSGAAIRSLYVLILTGRAEEDRIVEAFDAGVDDYIVKPFKPKLLLARIRSGARVVLLQEQAERDKQKQAEQNAELAKLNRMFKAAAMTDPLTGLPNRRYAMKRLETEWSSTERSKQPLSVIMLDIDRFKSVNDNFGHDAGDAVLVSTSRVLQNALRIGDTVARIGGEEFLVICPNTDLSGAEAVAQRICNDVAQNTIAAGDFRGNVTASLGVGTRGLGVPTVGALLKMADEAVYEGKRTGRNRVVVGRPPGGRAKSA